MLSELKRLDHVVREAYAAFDFKRIYFALFAFMTNDLSAFYFDVRKDRLYCDPASSKARHAALTVVDILFDCLVRWLAPMLPFTCDEAWSERHGEGKNVHLELFRDLPDSWRDEGLEAKWAKIRAVRSVVTAMLEVERKEKRIGSSLEAKPRVFLTRDYRGLVDAETLAEVCITSGITIEETDADSLDALMSLYPEAFADRAISQHAAAAFRPAEGRKCARSWKILPEVGSDPDYPDVTPRDAEALREYDAAREAAE
jgi:isoleucyl-tRNA synthetase